MAARSAGPRRHRMRKAARRESARAWIGSGAAVSVKAYGKRYGVDRYPAYDDLLAIGFALGPNDCRWAAGPPSGAPKRRTDPDADMNPDADLEWIHYGDEIMFVGHGHRLPHRDGADGLVLGGAHAEVSTCRGRVTPRRRRADGANPVGTARVRA